MKPATAAALLLLGAGPALGQDTARPRRLEPVVVTSDRTPEPRSLTTTAVTRLSRAELARMPHATLAELLRAAPGITAVDLDGAGFDPALMIRGFYGGGEAEYVVVLVDGQPVSQLQTGIVAWDVLPPLAAIDVIEVVRGGASSLYGDAAIGGVINVLTNREGGSSDRPRWMIAGGSAETIRAAADLRHKSYGLAGALDYTGGYRDHAERTAARVFATTTVRGGSDRSGTLSLRSHWRSFDEPGPLLETLAAENRRGSDPLFRFDHTEDKDLALGWSAHGPVGRPKRLTMTNSASVELRAVDAIRTLALAPGFGDTKERLAENAKFQGGAQLNGHSFVLGIEAGAGWLRSRYYRYAEPGPADPEAPSERGELDSQGNSRRATGALYAQVSQPLTEGLRLTVGARADLLLDRFESKHPPDAGKNATHWALSPKAGMNVRYFNGASGSGNLYLGLGRSFKAPTLDQLYDQRNIPVPFPPFQIQTSNPELVPQHGWNVEAGIYHSGQIGRTVSAIATLSLYQMWMRDELDFDVASFRYVNVGKSRHRGIEAGFHLERDRAAAFASYAWQEAIAQSGANSGKQLKAIPRHVLFTGASIEPRRGWEVSLSLDHVHGRFLDDANTASLSNYTRVDAQLSGAILGVRGYGAVRNLFNARYNSSGFPDPAGTGAAYFYPGAGRLLEVGVRHGW